MCIAKGLTSGYLPLGGTVVTNKIAKHFDDQALVIGLTYSAHAVTCAAGIENLKILHEENLVDNAANMGRYIEKCVTALAEKHPSIGDFRNTGLLGCIELVKDRKTKEGLTPWNAKPADSQPTARMAAKIRELGMFTFVKWNYIFIAPPLIISKAEVDEGMQIISEAVAIADEYYTGS
jgi:taurine--2-oxoglutarate transaminase